MNTTRLKALARKEKKVKRVKRVKAADDGGPAFPSFECWYNTQTQKHEPVGPTGMTLRDYFAASALQGLLADGHGNAWCADTCAAKAYKFADAMIAARKGGTL